MEFNYMVNHLILFHRSLKFCSFFFHPFSLSSSASVWINFIAIYSSSWIFSSAAPNLLLNPSVRFSLQILTFSFQEFLSGSISILKFSIYLCLKFIFFFYSLNIFIVAILKFLSASSIISIISILLTYFFFSHSNRSQRHLLCIYRKF